MEILNLHEVLDTFSLSAISTLFVLFFGILYFKLKNRDVPPGPWGLPLLGYWPFLKDDTAHLKLQNLMNKYGDVYSFTITGKLFIHLGTLKAIKEAFLSKSDYFTERYSGFSVLTSTFGKGVACENGESWKVLRKFFINAFREYGVTSVKDYMSGAISDSVISIVDDLKAAGGAPTNITSHLTTRSCAILRRILFNDDGMTEQELTEIIQEYEKVLPAFTNTNMLLNGNFSRYVIFPFSTSLKSAMKCCKKAVAALKKIIKRHEDTFDKDSPRDIIDSYIKERNERRSKGDSTFEYFTANALVSSLLQFVGDGTSGISVFISYFIYALLEYPEEQEKIFKELEEVIGPDRQPSLEDKSKLPYLNAFMQEILRTMDFMTLFATVECSKDTTLNGYRIPKGSMMLMNLWSAHTDPNVFEDPHEFKPSRYISEPGKQKAESPIIFGVGKRSCIGESYTMMQVFLFLATIIKKFRLEHPEGSTKKFSLEGNIEICAHPRK